MPSVAIVLLSIAAAVAYGVAHDQVTARVCVEYFTVGHPDLFGTDDPTTLAFGWGVVATWWGGVVLGIPLAIVARAGSRPARTVGSLLRPVGALLVVMAVSALVAGCAGWLLAESGAISLAGPLADAVPRDRHAAFLADLWAHSASYFVGFGGGIVTLGLVWRSRYRV